jgi:hypothetical protein
MGRRKKEVSDMSLPGFTADASVGPPTQRYRTSQHAATIGDSLSPQQLGSEDDMGDAEIPHEDSDEEGEGTDVEG